MVSLGLLDVLAVAPDAAVLDIGGGASVLEDRLLARGFSDVTVLDISASVLRESCQRMDDGVRVAWTSQDLLSRKPMRRYDLWHDRTVFHFLSGEDVESYREVPYRAVTPGGSVIMAAFG
ncbi:MAG: class I SAM-dependent methyltransferase [Acidimicrobiales bacterium]